MGISLRWTPKSTQDLINMLEAHAPRMKQHPSGMQMLHGMLVSHVLNTADEVQAEDVPVTPMKEGEPSIDLTDDELTIFITMRSLANIASGLEYMGFMLNQLNQARLQAVNGGKQAGEIIIPGGAGQIDKPSQDVLALCGKLADVLAESPEGPGIQGAYYRIGQACQVAMSAFHRLPVTARLLTEILKASNKSVKFHQGVGLGHDVDEILSSLQGRTEDDTYFDTLVENNVREVLDLLIRVEDNLPGALENQGTVKALVENHLQPIRLALINQSG